MPKQLHAPAEARPAFLVKGADQAPCAAVAMVMAQDGACAVESMAEPQSLAFATPSAETNASQAETSLSPEPLWNGAALTPKTASEMLTRKSATLQRGACQKPRPTALPLVAPAVGREDHLAYQGQVARATLAGKTRNPQAKKDACQGRRHCVKAARPFAMGTST